MRLLSFLSSLLIVLFLSACGGGGGSAGSSANNTPVVVAALSVNVPTSVTVVAGVQLSFLIAGGTAPYAVASGNTSVATVAVSGATGVITPLKAGTASIAVSDATGKLVTVSVTATVPALSVGAASSLTMAVGTPLSFTITGGTAPYAGTSSDSSVTSVSVSGSTVILTPRKSGVASVVITDSAAQSVTVAVTVANPPALAVNAPSPLALGVGALSTYQVSGGNAPYTVASSDSRIATGGITGSTLTITPLKAGSVSLLIYDASNTSVTISVAVDGFSAAAAVASVDLLPTSAFLSSASASTVSFSVTVKDQFNTTMPGQTITFSASSGSLVGANPSPVTGASGTNSSVTLSPGSDASNRSITVTAKAGTVSKSIVVPVTGTTVAVSGPGSTLIGASALTYTLKATDSAGKPIAGAALSVTSALGNTLSASTVTTDSLGVATVRYIATTVGVDMLAVTGLGASGQASVAVSNEDFSFTSPAPGATVLVSTPTTVTVSYRVGGVAQAGQSVLFSTTRGTIVAGPVLTDVNGMASTTINSPTSGPVTISAQIKSIRTTVTGAFVSNMPATLVLQASPNAILPNPSGSLVNQSTLQATVRDAAGNPVPGQTVNFTAVQDLSNGTISPGSVTTDSNGLASAQFVPGAASTPANGVTLQASVQSTSVSATTSLTVNGAALFISIGQSNELVVVDTNTYGKSFSVYVTDANGAPAGNRTVTLSAYPTTYRKGSLFYNNAAVLPSWVYNGTPTVCANEDLNRNGILDPGEDINGNGRLDPGLPVVLLPSTLTTDANGYSTFMLNYGKNYAFWLSTDIMAKSTVNGTESSKSTSFFLPMTASDATATSTPANVTSPFGVATVCTNPN